MKQRKTASIFTVQFNFHVENGLNFENFDSSVVYYYSVNLKILIVLFNQSLDYILETNRSNVGKISRYPTLH